MFTLWLSKVKKQSFFYSIRVHKCILNKIPGPTFSYLYVFDIEEENLVLAGSLSNHYLYIRIEKIFCSLDIIVKI